MRISIRKLKAIILYFGTYTDTKFLGKVKLMKLFYFLDFTHLKQYGTPVTFDTYVHLEHGPIPSAIMNLIDAATDDIDNSFLADTITIERPQGTQMCRILPNRKFSQADAGYFSETEMEIIKKVCNRFCNKNTKEIEDASHKEAPYSKTKSLEAIPYELAAEDSDCLVSKEEIKLLSEIC